MISPCFQGALVVAWSGCKPGRQETSQMETQLPLQELQRVNLTGPKPPGLLEQASGDYQSQETEPG